MVNFNLINSLGDLDDEADLMVADALGQEIADDPTKLIKGTRAVYGDELFGKLYGEILLAAGKPTDAAAAFQKSLERQPNRRRSIAGLAKARQAGAPESGQ